MRAYIARRLALGLLVLFGVSVITFVIARVLPSDPAALWAGPRARAEQIARARVELGLDRPLPVQYVNYVKRFIAGDWGKSIRTRRDILADIRVFFPSSLELVTVAMGLSVLVGIPLGVVSATRRDRWPDHLARVVSLTGVSMPLFWLGILLQLIFFSTLGWLPLSGRMASEIRILDPVPMVTGFNLVDTLLAGNTRAFWSSLKHLVLPAVTLAIASLAVVTRMTRASMLEVLGQDFIRTARAMGLGERRVLYRHALKNALIPTLTVVGLSFGYLIAGTFLVEVVFDWPGLGFYTAHAILNVDYPAIMAVTILVATAYVLINLVVDVVQAIIDPRVRLG